MKIICIGRNYVDHAKEMNTNVPKSPMIFMKPETALNLNDSLDYPAFTTNLHYEVELVLKINKLAKNVSLERANEYFDEIGLGIDFTARDIQAQCKEKGHPWEKAKAFDNSASLSPFVNKSDLDLLNLEFMLNLNNKTVQKGNSSRMIFDFHFLIHYVSKYFTFQPGDLLYTGTPAGVGAVSKNDKLVGFLNGKSLLEVSII